MPSLVRTGDTLVNQDDGGSHYDYAEDDYEDIDDEDDGVFEDEESVFDNARVASDSELVTRAQERVPAQIPGTPLPAAQHKLVAVFGQDGKMLVAKTTNGQRVTEWKPPTEREWELLRASGRIVRPADPTPPAVGEADEKKTSPWKKLAFGVVAVGAVGGLGYYAYRTYKKNKDDEDLDEEAKEI